MEWAEVLIQFLGTTDGRRLGDRGSVYSFGRNRSVGYADGTYVVGRRTSESDDAKALAQETPIIFLDEPTAFLDYPSKVEIMQLLYRLIQTTEKTIFLSTHDLDLALEIADKIG